MNERNAKVYPRVAAITAILAVATSLQCGTSTTSSSKNDAGSGGSSASGGSSSSGGSASSSPASTSSGSSRSASSRSGASSTSTSASSPADAGAPDDADVLDATAFGPDGACACRPYWCGCGTCDPSQIACTASGAVCARGCASACVAFTQVTCGCDEHGRCVRQGVDAAGVGCLESVDCPAGACCVREGGAPDVPGSCQPAPNAACQ